MKKYLCYLAIFMLVVFILTPPLLRIFYKEKEVVEVVKDKYAMLNCTKNLYTINASYKNDDSLSIKFVRPLIDENLEIYSEDYALEFVLDNELKALVNANVEGEQENQMMSYLLQYKNIVEDKLIKLNDYRLPLENQITHYEAHGYTCEVVEQ